MSEQAQKTTPVEPSNESKVEILKQNMRILQNMFTLLQETSFQGRHSAIVLECSRWVDQMHAAQSKTLQDLETPQDDKGQE
jgi:hypothetical protein